VRGSLSGALLPWANGSPIYIQSTTPGRYYLPCFSNLNELRLFLLRAKVFQYEVKRIIVGSDFLESFKGSNITVIMNPPQQADGQLQIGEFRLPGSGTWKLSQC